MEFLNTAYVYLEKLGIFGEYPATLLLLFVLVLLLVQMLRSAASVRAFEARVSELKERLRAADGAEAVSSVADSSKEDDKSKKKTLTETSPRAETSVAAGLSKTRTAFFSRIREAFASSPVLDTSVLEALEAQLIGADLGVKTTKSLLASLNSSSRAKALGKDEVLKVLKSRVLEILRSENPPQIAPARAQDGPQVVLIVGVNGVGKTTTIGKLAHQLKEQGARVLLGACDTFRAAAVEQMEIWAKRAGVDIVAGEPGSKPTTVAFTAIQKAKNEGYDVLLLDTAGRLHTRVNLMNELGSVIQIVSRELPGSPHETLLVLDATTGQNALQQAKVFDERCRLTGVVVTKLDGTPKGGMVVAVKQELGVPVRYIGVGESLADLRAFDPEEFVAALFGDESLVSPGLASLVQEDAASVHSGQIRRPRRERANEL